MPLVSSYDGYTWKSYPIPRTTIAAHIVESRDGKTTLDTTNNAGPDGDKAHLLLHGSLPSDEFYIKCQKVNGTIPFSVNHSGTVACPDVTLPSGGLESTISTVKLDIVSNYQDSFVNSTELNSHATELSEHKDQLDDATELSTEFTLVRRADDDSNTGTEFKVLSVNKLAASGLAPNISVYGDGNFSYIRQDEQGVNLAGLYRFGANAEQPGDMSSAGDGIHLNDNNNQLLCQVQEGAVTLRIEGAKDSGVNYMEIKDENNVLLFGVDRNGHHVGKHLFEDVTANVQDTESNEVYAGDASIYIGPVRLSFADGQIQFKHLTTIPQVLAASPFNITTADLSGRDPDEISARQWLALARNKVGDHSIRGKDVFTVEAEWGNMGINYASALTSDCQTQLEAIKTDITELDQFSAAADTDIDTLEATVLTLAPKASPVFSGQLALGKSQAEGGITVDIESSSDPHIQLTRTGFHRALITRHSDGYVGFSVANGSNSGQKFRINDDASVVAYGNIDVPTGSSHTVNNVDVVAVERSRIDSIMNLSNSDLNTFREIEDAYKAADSSITTTVTNLQSSHNADIGALDTRVDVLELDPTTQSLLDVEATTRASADTGITAAQLVITNAIQTDVDVNSAKTGITSTQAANIVTNNSKVTYDAQSAVSANSAKTGITSTQAANIVTNN